MNPILLLLAASPVLAGIDPYNLETEARRDPVGVDRPQPRLSWKLRSAGRAQAQTAYQVLVASEPGKLTSGTADLWDSGQVKSAETAWVTYGGRPLRSYQRCWWKLRVWDAAGTPSEWSEPAQWTMAILQPSEWKGRWIGGPSNALRPGPLPIFRKEIKVDRAVKRALVFISGLGFHELRLNGVKVGDHVLAPAWTNFRETVLYESFDVTPALVPGPNVLGVLLGNGFYNVAGGRYAKYTGSFGAPLLRLHLHLEFDDGTTSDTGTDGNWRVHDGPITFSCIYGGEDFDARAEPRNWDKPGFDDSGWSEVESVEAPGGIQRAQSSPPVLVQQTFRPVRVTQPRAGITVYDLGQNFSGWPKITVTGPPGAQVRLTPGEVLDPNGLVTQRSSGGPAYFSYTLLGSGEETWAPRFSYYGFRYVQVEGAAPAPQASASGVTLHALEGEFIHLAANRTGAFACSNDLFNRIHALIDAAVRSNLQHVLTDCPHREKLGWLEQSYLMGPSLLFNWDLRTFLPKQIRDIREAQRTSGLIPDIAPEYVEFGGAFRDSPEWGSAGIFLPWIAWQHYGDRETLAGAYAGMKAYTAYLRSHARGSILSFGLGDWYDIAPGDPGPSKLTPEGLTSTATWWADLEVMAKASALLGRDTESQAFAAEAAQVRSAFQREFFHQAAIDYASGSQTALAMPLALGLAAEPDRGPLVDKLVADIRRKGNHTSAGDIGYRYVLDALRDAGRSDVIFDMASQREAPSYAAQLAAGATSLTEAWDGNPNSSQNHLMLGHLEEWFYAGLAGFRSSAESAGATRIRIEPEPVGDVSWVKADWETTPGPVHLNWEIEADTFRITVNIPPGASAEIALPAASTAQVISSDVDPASGNQSGKRVVYQVGSGRYDFRVKGLVRPGADSLKGDPARE